MPCYSYSSSCIGALEAKRRRPYLWTVLLSSPIGCRMQMSGSFGASSRTLPSLSSCSSSSTTSSSPQVVLTSPSTSEVSFRSSTIFVPFKFVRTNHFTHGSKGSSASDASGPRCEATTGVQEAPLGVYISRKGGTEGFDCFAHRFPRVLPSGNSVCVVPIPSTECGNEMFSGRALPIRLYLYVHLKGI
jgi:hypothetical protein